MSARDIWTPGRKEQPFAEVEPNPKKLLALPDGRTFVDNTVTISLEDAEMMWQGYKCARCLEPFDEAYPVNCLVCGFMVRADQRRLLERDFLGRDPTLVGSFPLDREMEHLDRVGHQKKGYMTPPKEI
jgi:hypothetical protein